MRYEYDDMKFYVLICQNRHVLAGSIYFYTFYFEKNLKGSTLTASLCVLNIARSNFLL